MRVDAPPFGSVGGRASVIAKVSFIFPPRYSVLALLVLTSPLYPTRKIGDFSRGDPGFATPKIGIFRRMGFCSASVCARSRVILIKLYHPFAASQSSPSSKNRISTAVFHKFLILPPQNAQVSRRISLPHDIEKFKLILTNLACAQDFVLHFCKVF